MFKKLFSKKSIEEAPQTPKPRTKSQSSELRYSESDVTVIGELDGEVSTVELVRFELAKILWGYSKVKDAWIAKVQYADEEEIRVALYLDCNGPLAKIGRELALKVNEIIQIDVARIESLSSDTVSKIRSQFNSLYNDDNKLFVVPFVVKRGSNEHMPLDWESGLQSYIVAEKDLDLALHRAMAELEIQGFQFESFYEDKVLGIEVSGWWENYVLDRWGEHKELFLSQADIEILVKVGGLVRGPCLQWDRENGNSNFQ